MSGYTGDDTYLPVLPVQDGRSSSYFDGSIGDDTLIIQVPNTADGLNFLKANKNTIFDATLTLPSPEVNNAVDPHYFLIPNLEIRNIENIRVFIDESEYIFAPNQTSLAEFNDGSGFAGLQTLQIEIPDYSKILSESREFSISIDGLDAGSFSNWFLFDDREGLIYANPLNGDVGEYDITISASDILGDFESETFKITVENVNDAICFDFTPPADTDEDAGFSYQLTASDVDARCCC